MAGTPSLKRKILQGEAPSERLPMAHGILSLEALRKAGWRRALGDGTLPLIDPDGISGLPSRAMKVLREFQKFASRGNVIDLAVGVIIGASFGKIVTSLVNDIVMPPLGLFLGKADFSNLFISLSGEYATIADAKAAGAATLNYGLFINTVIEFLIVAFAVFLLVKQINRLQRLGKQHEPPVPNTKDCPYCLSNIPLKATRCAHCTSALKAST